MPELVGHEYTKRLLAVEANLKPIRVLYLDLDGTVRHGFDEMGKFVNEPDDVVIFPEALAAIREYKAGGWKIAAVSNQGGIALGHMSIETSVATMLRTQQLCEDLFDKIVWCRHHPQATDPIMAYCWCRKPRIGMVIEAAAEIAKKFNGMCPPHLALFVGDRPEDEECAKNAGIRFIEAKNWRAGER